MARLCERPGCSEPGAAAYGMVPEELLFWIAPLNEVPVDEHNVLCRRHADAMVVPRGWTLDDRREPIPRLFTPQRTGGAAVSATPRPAARRPKPSAAEVGEQLQIDGTGEIPRPEPVPAESTESVPAWQPDFDEDDDLDGLLEVRSPLLARAFRGTGRPRT